jgi:hypothetical protein
MGRRYFIKSIFQAIKIDFLDFLENRWNSRRLPSSSATFWLQYPPGRGRVFQQLARWPDGARHQIAAAVGADTLEFGLHAIGAEGAFIGADAGVLAVGRQVAVAAFAVGSQFEHEQILLPSDEHGRASGTIV